MRLHRIGERPGANGFGYFSRKKSDSRAQRVKALPQTAPHPPSAPSPRTRGEGDIS
jgi:hypothetical protein